ncbi:Crp/Fnr family transcriptional regulator [Paenibacillus sacheonensis]|uniref:Cyclic nucleotide-binding domain-containing protein n=1 Tax=Paenibacillus sacheonensis TaxID=742054 RepID=A0A7X4YUG9_9BACL|nr:Crp/Fnr family transcriptional regulator [Paenibacillus sacheonensis]MBM7569045.1 CRP/FNR family transcriptional regulator [Paenibacillus sacheonensis]NBC72775.1 cyclic nucleotide-binding domain-containing protein [Paenibacillus sacheonensis]
MLDKRYYLSKMSIFDALTPDDLIELDHISPMTHFNAIPKGNIIQKPDNARDGLYFIKEGKVRLYKTTSEGKQFTVVILGKGNVFGEIDTFSFGTKGFYIETMDETLLCSVSKQDFENFLAERPLLAMKMLAELSKILKDKDEMLEKLALGDVRERIVHLLLKLSERFGIEEEGKVRIDLPMTHQDVANMVGATREAVSIILKSLAKDNVIQTGRKTISISQVKAAEILELTYS